MKSHLWYSNLIKTQTTDLRMLRHVDKRQKKSPGVEDDLGLGEREGGLEKGAWRRGSPHSDSSPSATVPFTEQ